MVDMIRHTGEHEDCETCADVVRRELKSIWRQGDRAVEVSK